MDESRRLHDYSGFQYSTDSKDTIMSYDRVGPYIDCTVYCRDHCKKINVHHDYFATEKEILDRVLYSCLRPRLLKEQG